MEINLRKPERTEEYDVVVIGAGPSGCALAARLADVCPHLTVALLEAGAAKAGLLSDLPIGLAAIVARRSAINYAYRTVPQPGLGGRRGYQPRGRGLGGSSLINGMIQIRGHPGDYDDWERAGCPGWGWADVLPYFGVGENSPSDESPGAAGRVMTAVDLRDPNPVSQVFIEAGVQAGYGRTDDFNGDQGEGFGLYQVHQRDGRRWNAARAITDGPVRRNLHVVTDATAGRIVFEGRQAVGVEIRRGGRPVTVRARAEVVAACGAFGTPALLMRSGIGPAAHLREHGLAVVHDAPGVGSNLQDHPGYVEVRQVPDRNLVGISPGWVAQMVPEWLRWKRHGRGPLTSNLAEAGAFLKTDPALERPDIQLHFIVGMSDDHGRRLHMARGLSCHVCVLRPQSRGTVRLSGGGDGLAIDPGYFSAPGDMPVMMAGVRIARRVLAAPALAALGGRALYGTGQEDDEALEALIRRRADTSYHPVGTCRMGSDGDAVLDPALRVRGVSGLRVADASVMPTLVGGNTQAASAMIGMRAADLIGPALANGPGRGLAPTQAPYPGHTHNL